MDDLDDRVRDALAGRPEVLEAYVFGSVARGDARPDSDIDVAVTVDLAQVRPEDHPWGLRASLATDLIAALGRNDVDVVVLNGAPPLLWHRVLRDGRRVLARDLAAATTREAQALSRWYDWKIVQDRIDGESP